VELGTTASADLLHVRGGSSPGFGVWMKMRRESLAKRQESIGLGLPTRKVKNSASGADFAYSVVRMWIYE
jgi:hypothetical protein